MGAQQDAACGIASEGNKARAEKFRGSEIGAGIENRARIGAVSARKGSRLASPAKCGRHGEGNPGFPRARLARENGKGAGGQAVFPQPINRARLNVCKANQIHLAFDHSWIGEYRFRC
jgi:hypothetical protein